MKTIDIVIMYNLSVFLTTDENFFISTLSEGYICEAFIL